MTHIKKYNFLSQVKSPACSGLFEGKEEPGLPITRLDMISMAPKTQEVGAYKNQEVQHPTTQQHNIAGTVQQQVRQQQTQTVRSNKTENEEQKYDAKDRGKGAYGGSAGERKEKEKKEEEQRMKMRGSTFDITV